MYFKVLFWFNRLILQGGLVKRKYKKRKTKAFPELNRNIEHEFHISLPSPFQIIEQKI